MRQHAKEIRRGSRVAGLARGADCPAHVVTVPVW
jgi:hypothetical protein